MGKSLFALAAGLVLLLSACGTQQSTQAVPDRAQLVAELEAQVEATRPDGKMYLLAAKFTSLMKDGTLQKLLQKRNTKLSAQGVTGDCADDWEPGNAGLIQIQLQSESKYKWETVMNYPNLYYSYTATAFRNSRIILDTTVSYQPTGIVTLDSGDNFQVFVTAYGLLGGNLNAYGELFCTA